MGKTKKRCFIISCIAFLIALFAVRTNIFAAGISISRSSASLTVGETVSLNVQGEADLVTWSSSREDVASVDKFGKVTAHSAGTATVRAVVRGSGELYKCKVTVADMPRITYRANVEDEDWHGWVGDGETSGHVDGGERLEAIQIALSGENGKAMIQYRAHVSEDGWQNWVNSGQTAGTTYQGKRLEAVQIRLLSVYAKSYDVYYRIYVAGMGWFGWAKNGASAGTTGMSLRTEAIQIKIVKKGTPVETGGVSHLDKPELSYQAYMKGKGWTEHRNEGEIAGDADGWGQMQALQISLNDFNGANSISYRVYVKNEGWHDWKSGGQPAGTIGQDSMVEAVQMRLEGELSNYFDIYYRVRSFCYDNFGWAKNGEPAGTSGGNIWMNEFQIRLVAKSEQFDVGGAAYKDLTPSVKPEPERTTEIVLQHHMGGYSLKQGSYSAFVSNGVNYGCCAMSYAIGLSIVNRQAYNPTSFWYGGTTHYNKGGVGAGVSPFDAGRVYRALQNGKPTMINYRYKNNTGQHWVLIMGIRGGADINQLTYDDFYAIDPVTGSQVTLTSSSKWGGCTVVGIKVFQ